MGSGRIKGSTDAKPRKKRGPDKQPKKKQTLKTKTPEERQAFRDKKAAKARQNEEEKAGSFNNAEDSQKHKHGYETPTNMRLRLDSENSQKRIKLVVEMRKLKKQKSQGHLVEDEAVMVLQEAIAVQL